MCGVIGFCDFSFGSSENVLSAMRDELEHRGPDDGGNYWSLNNNYQLGLAHRRLSIIDISESGRQPMRSICGNYLIVFNGEIYNYKNIREELISRGEKFSTNSDTEVILNAYRVFGIDCIERLRGMFAFLIYDKKKQQLFAARDRLGVKPFFYFFDGSLFVIGSELKAIVKHPKIKRELDPIALAHYLQYGYVTGTKSIYKNITKLEKGHWLVCDLISRDISVSKYWDVNTFFAKPKIRISYNDFESLLLDKLKDAIRHRLIADVPVGLFLSGGYDSTLIATLLTKELETSIATFTMGFSEKEIDESKLAAKVADHLGTKHHSFYCTEQDALRMVQRLPVIFDEPFADPSSIPTMLVCEQTARYVKVAISADGGDENFFGYNRYISYLRRINQAQALAQYSILKKSTEKISRLLNNRIPTLELISGNIEEYLRSSGSHLKESWIQSLLKIKYPSHIEVTQQISARDPRDQILLSDFNHYLPDDVMVKVDRSSMAYGLEAREPLLDHELVEFVAQVPLEFKYRNQIQKFPVRSIVHRHVPEAWINQPKRGFSPPLNQWMKTIFNEEFGDLTSESFLIKQGLFDSKVLKDIMNSFSEEYLRYRFAWSIFMFQKWYMQWIHT